MPPNEESDPDAKQRKLQELLRQYRKVLIAYSGGVDSVFLLKTAVDTLGKQNVLACIGVSESLAQSEYREALEIADRVGATVENVATDELANRAYQANATDRCFHCRSRLYQLLNDIAQKNGCDAVLCGANADDAHDYRPGQEAAKQFGVGSPMEQVGLTKDEIRILSKRLGLPTWNKPAQPCLASRVSYGLSITPERLKQIEQGEEFLHALGLRGTIRVRHHGNLARIEVPSDDTEKLAEPAMRDKIVAFFKGLGFTYVTLDLQGFRSGSGNEIMDT